jgi:hypothetical protein
LFGQSAKTFEHPVQAFGTTGVSSLPQPAPQVDQAQRWIPSPHIPNQLELGFRMLIGMGMRTLGASGKRLDRSVVP